MSSFKNLKTRSKLLLAFGVILVLLGFVIVISYRTIAHIQETQRHIVDDDLSTVLEVKDLRFCQSRVRNDMLSMLLVTDRIVAEKLRQDGDEHVRKGDNLLGRLLERKRNNVAMTGLLNEFARLRAAFAETREKQVLPGIAAGRVAEARELILTVQADRNDRMTALGDQLAADAEKGAANMVTESARIVSDSFRNVILVGLLALAVAIAIALVLSQLIAAPLGKAVQMIREMSKGGLSTRLKMDRNDEIGALAGAMDQLADTVQDMTGEANKLVRAAVEGRLATRGDASKFEGVYRDIVKGVNDTLDAVIGPLNVAAGYVDRIARGDIPAKITDSYDGDFNLIKNNLNTCIDAVNALAADASMLSKAAVEGKLETRADANRHQGDFRKIVQGVNDTLDAVIGPLNVAADYVDRIAKGDIPAKITDSYNGDFNLIKNNLNTCIDATNKQALAARRVAEGDLSVQIEVRSENDVLPKSLTGVVDVLRKLQNELQRLTEASKEGLLSERGKPDQFKGAYAEVIRGTNAMLDTILLPIQEGNRVLSLIRGGNLRERVEIACKGDHARMKDAINGVHGWLAELVTYVTKVANGDMTAAMARASDSDQIHEWLMLLRNNINALVADANVLVKAAVEGKLATRADASKHQGDYRKIVEGVNQTLDAVIGPLNVAAGYVDRIARDDIPRPIVDKYNGDFDVLKTNLNKMIDSLRASTKELQSGFGVLASSSTEILATVSQVAASAAETATAVSETSTTAEEVKQTAHLSNQKAKAVQETAQKAAAVSETGRKAVSETIEGMNQIHEQMESIAESVVRLSEQGQTIGEIIATVNDLAEQSNLLAVNAAIEATRAGEYGRGFAVVAQEVRSLAEQSRRATTQVRTILMDVQKATSAAVMATEQGTKAVAAGVKQATDAGDSIRALTSSVGEAAQAATQIAASSQQQLVGMDQIASAIANIRQATTQNMAGTKQLQASAQSLQELGGRLKALVERQRVEG